MMASIFFIMPGWFIRTDCRLLNSLYLWAARKAYDAKEGKGD